LGPFFERFVFLAALEGLSKKRFKIWTRGPSVKGESRSRYFIGIVFVIDRHFSHLQILGFNLVLKYLIKCTNTDNRILNRNFLLEDTMRIFRMPYSITASLLSNPQL
jgi:hypothetical protein